MDFHLSPSDSKSLRISKTLQSFLFHCRSPDCFDSSFNLQFLHSLFPVVKKSSKGTKYNWYNRHFHVPRGCPRGVMIKALSCRMAVSDFEFPLCYYVHFRTNTLGITPPYPPNYGLNNITTVLLEG